MAQPTAPPAAPHRWFVAIELRRSEGRIPSHLVHAKEMGTTLTVCDRPASAMDKRWELGFLAPRDGQSCQVCLARVTSARSR